MARLTEAECRAICEALGLRADSHLLRKPASEWPDCSNAGDWGASVPRWRIVQRAAESTGEMRG